MDSTTASSLLDALRSSDYKGLYDRFSSFLLPFGDFIPLDSHRPGAGKSTGAASKMRGAPKKKKKPETNSQLLRPLAKQFLPFLCHALKLLPALLRKIPKSPSDGGVGGGREEDEQRATELLGVYGLTVDCLSCIGPCLAGKPYSVHLQRGRLVCSLEAWGRYARAEKEAISLLESLRSVLVAAAPKRKSQRGKVADPISLLPDPKLVGADDPEVATMAIEVIISLVGCAFKSKTRDGAAYERILALVDQVQPWLQFLDPEAIKKYHLLLVNALYRCSLFLAGESMSFDGYLAKGFCLRTLRECLKSSSMDRFPMIARKICTSIDSEWDGRAPLLLDMLRATLESGVCGCKVGVVKAVNQILEFVSYCADIFCATNVNVCKSALKVLYEKGDDFLQVSPPFASILILYASGLYIKSSNIQARQYADIFQSSNGGSSIMLLLDNGENVQKMTDSLGNLARYFDISSYRNEVILDNEEKDSRDLSTEVLESTKHGGCKHLHGSVSLISYLDALEFLCKLLYEYVNIAAKHLVSQRKTVVKSANVNHVLDALHQFCDFILAAVKCTKAFESYRERLHDSHGTLLQVAASAFKFSLLTSGNYQKSLCSINCIISSEWIEPQELKFLIAVFSNIGASLYDIGHLEEATIALQLCCRTMWAHIKLLCHIGKLNGTDIDDNSEDGIRDVIKNAFTRTATIVDILYKCSAKNIQEVVVKSLYEFSAAEDRFQNTTSSLDLVKLWVKMICKDFEDADSVEIAPVLYSLLISYYPRWSKKTVGKILEQELIAYGMMEARYPDICQKMQLKVVDILLNEVYTTKDYYMQRSRIFVRKGKVIRGCGVEGLSRCIECLSEAISLLQNDISGNPSQGNASVLHHLALIYCLLAQCAQEANQDGKIILDNVGYALKLWLSMDIQSCSADRCLERASENVIPILCAVVDLLSLKGCLKFQNDICKLMIMLCKWENIPLEKCIAMLWSGRRLSHSLCSSPISENFILDISKYPGVNADSFDYWINCIKGHPPSLCMFLQKLSLNNSVFPEVSGCTFERSFGSQITVDEVKKVASSLIVDVPLPTQSAFIAGYLYYDLSERLFSRGRISEALSYAREAFRLRKKLLQRKFIYSVEQQSAKSIGSGKATQSGHDHICLEAMGSVISEVWPDIIKSGHSGDFILTPWGILGCYLESILQVGMIHESMGNGTEAENLFRRGKVISSLQGLPILETAFTSLLGQLYRRKQLWDLAETELNYAKTLLEKNDTIISCKHCKLAFEVTIDMQIGDLFRNLFDKGLKIESTKSISDALVLYRLALDKLNHAELCSYCTEDANHGDVNADKVRFLAKKMRSPLCSICASLNHISGIPHAGQMPSEVDKLSPLNAVGKKSLLNMEVKKRSKNPSKFIAKEQNLNVELKPRRTHSTNRSANIATEVDSKYDRSDNHGFCPDTHSLGKVEKKLDETSPSDFGCSEQCICNRITCWRCLVINVMETGSMKNIIHLKWKCHHRRVVLVLLLKIARCLGAYDGKHAEHEVHDALLQYISVFFSTKPFSQSCHGIPDCHLIELIVNENSSDAFSIERAALLYHMSWLLLKDCLTEHPRTICCGLSKMPMSNIVSWLLRAFMLCCHLPLLSQKVSRLLSSLFLLSTLDGSITLPLHSEKSLSLNHWAAYFHQASIGTYMHCQYLSCVRDLACNNNKTSEGLPSANIMDADTKASKFFRSKSAPEKLEHIEEHVKGFFQSLPRVPIICISMLGGDYVNLLGKSSVLPSCFPAWMLLSRFDAFSEPVVMLLPVDILEDIQLEDTNSGKRWICAKMRSVREWQCPWNYTIVDHIAPSFRLLLEENFLSVSNTTPTPANAQMNNVGWWLQRTRLNNCLNKLLKSMEESWLGPWRCLLLGQHSDPEYMDVTVSKLIRDLKSQFKFEVNGSTVRAILGGAKSVDDAEACISQVLLYKGYFGRGACCGEERFGALSAACHAGIKSVSELVRSLIQEAIKKQEPMHRHPIILVLDSDVQMLPWENLPILRSQEVYRMLSVGSILSVLNRCCSIHKLDKELGAVLPAVDPANTYYLLNPGGDLNSTQVEFEQLFRDQKWEGKAGNVPTTEELVLALQSHDLFLYFGHGSGTQYISVHEIQKLDRCAASLLMGCSSGSVLHNGCYAPQGVPISYLRAGSPAVIANLWDVTDKDIDRFGKAILDSWLQEESAALDNCTRSNQLVKQFGCMSIDGEGNDTSLKTRKRTYRGKKQQQSCEGNKCKGCGRRKMMASFMSQARDACKLPLLIGASPVCYGVPTIISRKS
ncbi:separase isoform X2 [Elaeis guineensis]|uniref:separase n=1 Tax=Elaeis guineensis var. tenera TaxID=51953 RepID=A0A6I9QGF0_ELAGV|nr:separase isoform X1 [Elaeis guineensis]